MLKSKLRIDGRAKTETEEFLWDTNKGTEVKKSVKA